MTAALAMAALIVQGPSVTLRQEAGGWTVVREGKPFVIRGAGGSHSLAALAAAGGNSVRTWGADRAGEILDEAHRLGLTVTVGIWLGHKEHGFYYNDAGAVRRQLEQAKAVVLKHRRHPALLMWGIGNEMEGFADGADPAVWRAVEGIAKAIKELDPYHPTMTVIAELGGARVKSVHEHCPSIDVVGVNSYGGAPSIPERYAKAGGTKPYVVTEFGPLGQWEVAKTPWSAPIEVTSTEKAKFYRRAYEANSRSRHCLGSYAFLWGHKQEATSTWFGMFLPDGTRLASVDTMQELWSGRPPSNRVPEIERLEPKTPVQVEPGGLIELALVARDPERDRLQIEWLLQAEQSKPGIGGQVEPEPQKFPSALVEGRLDRARFRMPMQPGAYRVFVTVRDGHGGGATANLPLFVKEQ